MSNGEYFEAGSNFRAIWSKLPSPYTQFSDKDRTFLKSRLEYDDYDSETLDSALADPELVHELLTEPQLLEALQRDSYEAVSPVSPTLYYAILTRHTLRASGLESRFLSEVLTQILLELSSLQRYTLNRLYNGIEGCFPFTMSVIRDNRDSEKPSIVVVAKLGEFSMQMAGHYNNSPTHTHNPFSAE